MKKLLAIALGAAAMLAACSGHKGWKVEGQLQGSADSCQLVLEGFNGAKWYVIDTLALSNGKFSYASPQASPYSDIYRLTMDGKSIYFPIDSIETITIDAKAQNFDIDYELSGSAAAQAMAQVDKQVARAVAAQGVAAALADSVLKRELNEIVLSDSTGVVAYYIVNKTVGGRKLYDDNNRKDVAIVGAAANILNVKDANDPRAMYLANRYKQARRQSGLTPGYTLEVPESGLVEIELYDVNGHKQKLSDTAKGAGITLLSFTNYGVDGSLAYNMELNRLYDLYKGKNIAIYQVSVGEDEVEWRQAAMNLPWTAVRNSDADGDTYMLLYNVDVIPLTFVIDRNGDLQERVVDPSQLEGAIRKHL